MLPPGRPGRLGERPAGAHVHLPREVGVAPARRIAHDRGEVHHPVGAGQERRHRRPVAHVGAHELEPLVIEEDDLLVTGYVETPTVRFRVMYEGLGAMLPATDACADRALTLPMFAHMTDAQLELVVEALRATV